MKKIITIAVSAAFFNISAFSQELPGSYNGKTVKSVNVSTKRIKPSIIKKKFLISEGKTFDADDYELAKQSLHDMRIFKEIDFAINENEDATIDINIDAKDSFFVFPMIFGTGGSKSTYAAMIMEANLFKRGETSFVLGAFNSDGYSATAVLGLSQNFFSLGVSGFEYEEKFYENDSYNNSGLFSSDADKNVKYKDPLKKYDVDAKGVKAAFSKTFFEKTNASLGFDFSQVKYRGSEAPQDEGSHNKIFINLRHSQNFNSAAGGMGGFGALFGIGLSDVDDLLSRLPKPRYGYFASLVYENGGSHTGSDYSISKLSARVAGKTEFTTRHFLTLELAAAKAFETPYFDRIRSGEVMGAKGTYSKDFRGESAVGASLSLFYYLLKNKRGMMYFMPFAETSVVWDKGCPRNQTLAGASIAYRLWRIPFPIGLKYTCDFTNGEQVTFLTFGG
jgi:outer membrane protein assembly factor BamA